MSREATDAPAFVTGVCIVIQQYSRDIISDGLTLSSSSLFALTPT